MVSTRTGLNIKGGEDKEIGELEDRVRLRRVFAHFVLIIEIANKVLPRPVSPQDPPTIKEKVTVLIGR